MKLNIDWWTDIKIKWEGYDEEEQSPPANVPVQTEMTLMGYGKPLAQPVAETPPENAEKPEKKLRQAPCDKMVRVCFPVSINFLI